MIDRLTKLITEELGIHHMTAVRCGEITADTELEADLGCNSIDRVCLTCSVEEVFGIDVPDAVAEGWETVGDILASVEALLVTA